MHLSISIYMYINLFDLKCYCFSNLICSGNEWGGGESSDKNENLFICNFAGESISFNYGRVNLLNKKICEGEHYLVLKLIRLLLSVELSY